jgi:predicted Zn-dependent peptidase
MKKHFHFSLILTSLLLFLLSFNTVLISRAAAQTDRTTPDRNPVTGKIGEQQVILEELPNGLKILALPMPSSTVAYGMIAVKVGGRYEPEKTAGISHLLEHLLLKDREQFKPLTQIRETGGNVNGLTDMELTSYYFTVLPQNYASAMNALSRMLIYPQFTLYDLIREREVVLEELAMGLNDPRALVLTQLVREVFPRSPFTNLVIGTKRSLKRISMADVQAFYDTYYVPQNMVVIAAGRIDAEKALRQMRSLFGGQGKQAAPHRSFEVPTPAVHHLTKKIPINQSFYVWGSLTPGKESDDYYTMRIMDILFGSGVNSRLYNRIVWEGGFTEQLYPIWFSYSNTGAWAVFLSVSPDDLGEVSSIIYEEMESIQNGNFTLEYLQTVKRALIAKLQLSLDSPRELALFHLENILNRTDVTSVEEYIESIEAVSRADVIDLAKAYFSPEKTVTIEIIPARGPEKLFLILKYLATKSI